MTEDHPIVPQDHALLRPQPEITAREIEAARDAILRGEDIDVVRFGAAHGAIAGEWLSREMGEVGRG